MIMHRAFIALGSNLGDRAGNLRLAVEALRGTEGVEVTAVSGVFDNPAVGGPGDSPRFLNAAAELQTSLSPQALLSRLLEIEHQMGRVRSLRNEPRIIDLDLLLYGDQVIRGQELDLPHPRMQDREFVLRPMVEIAPELRHPILKLTMRELLEAMERKV